jgi:hypothetical protein
MVNDDGAPKSAYELAMERLRKKDDDAGVRETPLTEEQRAKIAEARKVYEARKAEREILHQSSLRGAADPESLERLEEEYRRDLERLTTDRDRKIDEIRHRS